MTKLGKQIPFFFHLQRAHLRGIRVGNEEFLIFFFIKKNWLDTTLFIKECEVFFFETTARIQYIIFQVMLKLKKLLLSIFFLFLLLKKSRQFVCVLIFVETILLLSFHNCIFQNQKTKSVCYAENSWNLTEKVGCYSLRQ